MPHDAVTDFLTHPTSSRFENAVAQARETVHHTAARIVRDDELADDVAQEVFTRLWEQRLPASGVESGTALLLRTTVLIATERLRSECRRRAAERRLRRAAPLHEGSAFTRDDVLDLQEALLSLKQKLGSCVMLRYYGGFGVNEIARELSIHPRTVLRRLGEARGILRERLATPALLSILSILVREAEAARSAIGCSPELARRLAEIPAAVPAPQPAGAGRRIATRTGTAGRRAAALRWAAVIFLAAAPLLGGWMLLAGGGGGSDIRAARRELTADASRGLAPRPQPALARAEPASRVGPRAAAREAAPETRSAPSDKPIEAAPAAPAAPAGPVALRDKFEKPALPAALQVRAADQHGRLLADGSVVFRVHGLPTLDDVGQYDAAGRTQAASEIVHLRSLADATFAARSLAEENPLRIEGIAGDLQAFEVEARVAAVGVTAGEPVRFRLKPGELTKVEITATVGPRLEIEVVDDWTSLPIAGAGVTAGNVRVERPSGAAAVEIATEELRWETSAEGRCTLPGLFSERRAVRVDAAGYEPAVKDLGPVDEEDPPLRVTVRLRRPEVDSPKTGSLVVLAVDSARRPVAGARIRIIGWKRREEKETDAGGACRLEGLREGDYHCRIVQVRGYPPGVLPGELRGDGPPWAQASVKAGEEARVTVGAVRGAASLVVDVVDAKGRPAAGVRVGCLGRADFRYGVTDARGRAVFDRLRDDTFTVTLEDPQRWALVADPVPLSGVERKQVRVQQGSAALRGRVVGAGGGPPSAKVTVTAEGKWRASVETDAEGRFEIAGAPPGTYEVSAWSAGKRMSDAVTVVVDRRGDPAPLEVRLQP
jgi:RNA polymerase sigma-70 factor (ECF subfamily)